jgi:hypothetical protein
MRATVRLWLSTVAVVTVGTVGLMCASSVLAVGPWWQLGTGSRPAVLPSEPGQTGELFVTAENLGDGTLDGVAFPVTFTDTLPAGLEATAIVANERQPHAPFEFGTGSHPFLPCAPLPQLSCELNTTLLPYDTVELRIDVRVKQGAHSGELNSVSVSGGNIAATSIQRALSFGEEPTPFAVEDFRSRFEEEGGGLDTRAGSHPFQMTTTVALNQATDVFPLSREEPNVEAAAMARDVITKFPPGFIGDPGVLPTCSLAKFLVKFNYNENLCPADTAIGIAAVTVNESHGFGQITFTVPLFNLEPYYGEPARFGFFIPNSEVPVLLDASLRSGAGEGALPGESEDYGINVDSTEITQTASLLSARVTVWGVPGDPRHDAFRGWGCLQQTRGAAIHAPCVASQESKPPAFLTLPTSCAGPLQFSVQADSWTNPGAFADFLPSEPQSTLEGCNRLPFSPTIEASPTTRSASSPSGLDFNLDFHNEGLTNAEGLVQSELKDTTVTLPEGFTIDPSAGVGLAGCTRADYAHETVSSTPGAGCPNESKLGTVEIHTPVLSSAIHGSLFIAQPYENPFGSLVALYIVAKNPETGILVKLAGRVTPNPVTGQLVTTFENTPQLPFDHFNFHFREGQQAPLITPSTCGTYTTTAQLTPWSEPTAALTDTSSFEVTTGAGGGPCPSGGAPPFNPGIVSGTINNSAGSYSPFYLHLTRTDAEQEISGFSTNLPSGLTGDLTGIPFCPEADIQAARHKSGVQEEAQPSCPEASRIGRTLVGTGVGAVLAYVPGKLYLAGPFHGAPFSILSVTSAVVGPFDLGTVVLRFGLTIDPYTARVSVTPTSSEPIPTIIRGIITHVRDIRVYVDRPHFTLNPTSCNPLRISSTLDSPSGASSTVGSPFQAANCQALGFRPIFKVSTTGRIVKKSASLHVALTYPTQGAQANISQVKVDLPRQLPSKLPTLQQACPAHVFNTNPAQCSTASRVGYAKATTPLIPVPLEGPAYFVSHGGEAFPNLIIVLQGYGVTIDLVGDTFINEHTNITSSTFKTIPDQPVGSFELTLPQGKYSALAAPTPLCGKKLTMPTSFTAQNGMVFKQTTPITITNCPKTKKAKHKAKKASRHRTKRK